MGRKQATRRKALLATVLFSASILTVFLFTIPSGEAAPSGNCTYYSSAAKTTVVGQFGKDCCNNTVAWGVKTKWSTCGGCFICFPPPR